MGLASRRLTNLKNKTKQTNKQTTLSPNGWPGASFTSNNSPSTLSFIQRVKHSTPGYVHADMNRTGRRPCSPGAYVPMKGEQMISKDTNK